MSRTIRAFCVLSLFILLTAACSKAPTAEIEAADQALQQARVADAADYAPESLAAAEEARASLDAELKAQEDRSALTRSYKHAKELAVASQQAADKAAADAAEGRNQARDEAANLISEVKTMVTEIKGLLDKAPRGKGSAVDLAALKSDLSGIESSLPEIDSAFAAERFAEARTKAQAAKESAELIRTDVTRAIETAKRARAGSR